MFPLKDRLKHKANIVYRGACSCNDSCIGETECNAEVRWKEHCSINEKRSEVAEHLLKNPGHTNNRQVTTFASHQWSKQKIPGVCYITKSKPSLNNQLDIKIMHFFRNGIT